MRGTDAIRDVVEVQRVARLPGHNMIGAGRVAAYTQRADQIFVFIVERQSAPKYIDAPDLVPNNRIVRLAIIRLITAVGDAGVQWIAVLQSIERTAGLRRGIEIRRGQGEFGKAE